MSWTKMWIGDYSDFSISAERDDVRITKAGYPDKRYNRGKQMIQEMKIIDKNNFIQGQLSEMA